MKVKARTDICKLEIDRKKKIAELRRVAKI